MNSFQSKFELMFFLMEQVLSALADSITKFACLLAIVDMTNHQSFEQLSYMLFIFCFHVKSNGIWVLISI